MSSGSGRSGVPPILVLRKVRQVLDCFSISEPELTLQQITRATRLPGSTCQRLVHNLVREGFLDRDEDRYRIGLGLVRWAAPGTASLDLVQLTREVLRRLRDQTGETSCLYLRDGAFRTLVAMAETHNVVMRMFRVGMVLPLHAGSAGKVFMAFDPAARAAAVGYGLARHTPHTVVDIDQLDRHLAEIRATGYCASFEERDLGASSLSAPVRGSLGELTAVIGIGAPIQRLTPIEADRLAPLVLQAAADASVRMGYQH
ncbi:MAG: IclR family transcriptional regulator [Jatrophihabitantaceae bacterium]